MDDDLRETVASWPVRPGATHLRVRPGGVDDSTFLMAWVVTGAVVGWILALI